MKQEHETQNILFYFNTTAQVEAVTSNKGQTCQEKESVLDVNRNQIMSLQAASEAANCTEKTEKLVMNGTTAQIKLIDCFGERRFITRRPRTWFIAVSNCNSTTGLNLSYHVNYSTGSNVSDDGCEGPQMQNALNKTV